MKISHNALLAAISYDPETGAFRRLNCPSANAKIGRDACNYVRFMVGGISARGHVWAWFFVTGEWPSFPIDHRNGNRADNRWTNLRAATAAVNRQNQRGPSRENQVGLLGVHLGRGGRYRASIGANGQKVQLGTFDTAEQAHDAYVMAKRRLHPGNTL